MKTSLSSVMSSTSEQSQTSFRESYSCYQTLNGDLHKLLKHWEKDQEPSGKRTDLGIWSSMNWPWGISYTISQNLIFSSARQGSWTRWAMCLQALKSHFFFTLKNTWKLKSSSWVTRVLLPYADWTHICYCKEKKNIHLLSSTCVQCRISSPTQWLTQNCHLLFQKTGLSNLVVNGLPLWSQPGYKHCIRQRMKNILQYPWLTRKAGRTSNETRHSGLHFQLLSINPSRV